MTWSSASWRLNSPDSPSIRLFVQLRVQDDRKKNKYHITDPLWGESQGSATRKHFHLMTFFMIQSRSIDWFICVFRQINELDQSPKSDQLMYICIYYFHISLFHYQIILFRESLKSYLAWLLGTSVCSAKICIKITPLSTRFEQCCTNIQHIH